MDNDYANNDDSHMCCYTRDPALLPRTPPPSYRAIQKPSNVDAGRLGKLKLKWKWGVHSLQAIHSTATNIDKYIQSACLTTTTSIQLPSMCPLFGSFVLLIGQQEGDEERVCVCVRTIANSNGILIFCNYSVWPT